MSARSLRKNVVITGAPKSGKSTVLRSLISAMPHKTGFLTREILGEAGRVGFEIETSSGEQATLARIDVETPIKVGKYFVDIRNLERVLERMPDPEREDVLYLDEIGQMQLFSERFKHFVREYFGKPQTCIATLTAVYEDEFTHEVQARTDVIRIAISPENREDRALFIPQLLKKIEKARGYVSEPERFAKTGASAAELASEHGLRKLHFAGGKWRCSCDFFATYGICSHAITADALA